MAAAEKDTEKPLLEAVTLKNLLLQSFKKNYCELGMRIKL